MEIITVKKLLLENYLKEPNHVDYILYGHLGCIFCN